VKVLFVCSGNTCRSPVAEALLKKFRPDVQADSAGTFPASFISEIAREYLARENAERYLKRVPESLDEKTLSEYDVIVAMELEHKEFVLSKCKDCEGKVIVWNIKDPYFLPRSYAEKIFAEIKKKVSELAENL